MNSRKAIKRALSIAPICAVSMYYAANHLQPAYVAKENSQMAYSGEEVELPKGCKVWAAEDVVLQLPGDLLKEDEVMGKVIDGPDDMGFRASFDEGTGKASAFYVKLARGQVVEFVKPTKASVQTGAIRIDPGVSD